MTRYHVRYWPPGERGFSHAVPGRPRSHRRCKRIAARLCRWGIPAYVAKTVSTVTD